LKGKAKKNGNTEGTEFAEKRNPRAQSGMTVPQEEEPKTQAHTPYLEHPAERKVHRKERPKSTDRSVCATAGTEKE
jgi:hypothetical protein